MENTCRSATDVGRRREHNEDAYLVDDALQLYVVADGMGGHACGEVASGLAVQAFRDFVDERSEAVWGFRDGSPSVAAWMVRGLLEDAVHSACRTVWSKAQEDSSMRGMGTTLVALLLAGDRAFVVHVGDSRAYLVRGGSAVQLTRDHSVLNELLRRGEINEESANSTYAGFRNALSRAVGVCEDVDVDSMDFEVLPDDLFVLCSDGLTRYVTLDELPSLSTAVIDDPAASLVTLANDRGGDDNITAVVIRTTADPVDPSADETRAREFATKLSTFRAMPIFRRLDYGELIRVLATTDVVVAKRGHVILREGQECDAMYVVLSGKVGIDRGNDRVSEYHAGAHFGEVSLVDGGPRAANATAMAESRLVRLGREHLDMLLKREPEIAVKLLWSFTASLGERLRTTAAAFAELGAIVGESVMEDL